MKINPENDNVELTLSEARLLSMGPRDKELKRRVIAAHRRAFSARFPDMFPEGYFDNVPLLASDSDSGMNLQLFQVMSDMTEAGRRIPLNPDGSEDHTIETTMNVDERRTVYSETAESHRDNLELSMCYVVAPLAEFDDGHECVRNSIQEEVRVAWGIMQAIRTVDGI